MTARPLAFANNIPGAGLAAEVLQLRAALAAMTDDRDRWRDEARRAQANCTVAASARRLRMQRRAKPVSGQGALLA